MRLFKGKPLILLLALVLAGAGWFSWSSWKKRAAAPKFKVAAVERGDIRVSVTATGTLQALVTVLVGTQVSGPIASLHADFNSEVKKGQVIARLDTTLLRSALDDALSNLTRVEAQESQAAQAVKRTRALFDRSLVSQAELDVSDAAAKVASANLRSARSQVERARINLKYATITSPIDGIVLSRAVELGQTVAASFNTPTLFTIAGDLRQMEVKASVDEADIGKVSKGQRATFTVDAYPDAVFAGTVEQVRLEPKVDQNVVSYAVVIRVPNPDLKLMPGMTASLTITVSGKENVLMAPSSALRFHPPGDSGSARKSKRPDRAGGRGNGSGSNGRDTLSMRGGGLAAPGTEGQGRGRVFLLVDGKPKPARVRTGLSDGSRSEIEGEVREGDSVIVGIESALPAAKQGSPLGMTPRGGSGGGGRRGY